jgi:putative membrane protein
VPAEPAAPTGPDHATPHRGTLLFRAPSAGVSIAAILAISGLLALLMWGTAVGSFSEGFLLVWAIPALIAAFATSPLAAVLGGRLEMRRAIFLSLGVLVIQLPLAAIWRGALEVWPGTTPGVVFLGAFLAGPSIWFRQISLFGLSRPSHAASLPPALLQPAVSLIGLFILFPPNLSEVAAAVAFLAIGFACGVALLRAADRPMRREFQSSGISLIRPLLDHVGLRDPGSTKALEGFFDKFAFPSDLRMSLLTLRNNGSVRATIVLPTVHPGPFAALGASDLPRKLTQQLGPSAGFVLVPHTPSDHDLDLPTSVEVDKFVVKGRELLASPGPALPSRGGPLVRPYPDSAARAQWLGNVALVVITQAPAPTDDISFAVADRIEREVGPAGGGPRLAMIDAHNSYIEGKGDILYGTPIAEKVVADVRAAVSAAKAAAVDGPIQIGVAARSDYETGRDGIGPEGIRALAVRAGGKTTGYVLIDGNNLLVGFRDPIVRALEKVVDIAEVMTTDNHIVHEVDGGINPVGERRSCDLLAQDSVEVLQRAVADLGPVDVHFGERSVPAVKVLGAGFTARLLTSLGDTLSMFSNMAVATFLLLLTSSLVVTFALK